MFCSLIAQQFLHDLKVFPNQLAFVSILCIQISFLFYLSASVLSLYTANIAHTNTPRSPMDAAKVMWLMYECPETRFEGLAMRFMDIRKRVYDVPTLGTKALMVAIPTTSGTGSEVTPFSVVTDQHTGVKCVGGWIRTQCAEHAVICSMLMLCENPNLQLLLQLVSQPASCWYYNSQSVIHPSCGRYPLADYALTPTMAIVDPDLVDRMPRGLTAAGGIDAVTHAIESYVSVCATEYTQGLSKEALTQLFRYLPAAYANGGNDLVAREKVHYAATIAGMAFANAFLGICHSMAHKLGSSFHIPHGIANALLISHVIRYNATDAPFKQAIFPQYAFPAAKSRWVVLWLRTDSTLFAFPTTLFPFFSFGEVALSYHYYNVSFPDTLLVE